jgi:hypothetical protein
LINKDRWFEPKKEFEMMEKSKRVTLHPTKGVNPRLTCCEQCGGEMNDLILLGTRDYYTTCAICDVKLIGGGKCPKCQRPGINKTPLPPGPLPSGVCASCQEKNKQCEEMVVAGGIYWKCGDCGSMGAVSGDSELSKRVRAQMGIEPPQACGVEFDKDTCPTCIKLQEEK